MKPGYLALLFCTAIEMVGCSTSAKAPQNAATAIPAPAAVAPAGYCTAIPLGKSFCQAVVIEAPKGTLRLAIAQTGARRERGLMGVHSVPAGQGMLFVFPDVANVKRGFWMKDTVTPLDMVFVRTDGVVTQVSANVPATKPGTPDLKIAHREGIGRYVIELRAGGAQAAGLQPGSALSIPAIDDAN